MKFFTTFKREYKIYRTQYSIDLSVGQPIQLPRRKAFRYAHWQSSCYLHLNPSYHHDYHKDDLRPCLLIMITWNTTKATTKMIWPCLLIRLASASLSTGSPPSTKKLFHSLFLSPEDPRPKRLIINTNHHKNEYLFMCVNSLRSKWCCS